MTVFEVIKKALTNIFKTTSTQKGVMYFVTPNTNYPDETMAKDFASKGITHVAIRTEPTKPDRGYAVSVSELIRLSKIFAKYNIKTLAWTWDDFPRPRALYF